jgi:hypothetical protein
MKRYVVDLSKSGKPIPVGGPGDPTHQEFALSIGLDPNSRTVSGVLVTDTHVYVGGSIETSIDFRDEIQKWAEENFPGKLIEFLPIRGGG